MPQPQRDFAEIAGGLQHVHSAAMSQNMRCYAFGCDRGHTFSGVGNVRGENVLEPGPRHRETSGVEK